jgi:6-phosphogluconolactonase
MTKLGMFAGLTLALVGCVDDGQDGMNGANGADGSDGADGTVGAQGPAGPQLALPALYTLGNASAGNQVAGFLRADNGNLSRNGTYATTGKGLGAGLGSQGALVFDAHSGRFFAVNAGDDSISMLAIDADGELTQIAKIASGGKRPVSLAVHGDVVYVANQGDAAAAQVGANISGFRMKGSDLLAIAGSTRALSATTDVHPTDLAFTPDGAYVVVIERFTSKLDTFKLVDGVAQPGNFQASAGMQPFAFDWSPEGKLVVAEVGNGTATGSSVSSYSVAAGVLTPITSALPTQQGAACWIVVAGGFAYVANAATANITGVAVSETGALTLRDAGGVTATTGAGANDLAVSPDHGYLYSLAAGPHEIRPFAIRADGSLTALPALTGVPVAAQGLVAR